MRPLTVAIVGCGTAGGAAALSLHRAGHAITVFERVPKPTAVGAGIMLQPTGMRALQDLGLRERVVLRGDRVTRLFCTNEDRKTILDIGYEDLDKSLFGLGLHRGVLFEALYDDVLEAEIDLRTGVEIERARQLPSGAWEIDGERFDLVVVADGARSKLSAALPISRVARPYPWGALWYIAQDRDKQFSGTLRQHVRGARTLVGLLPTGLGPRGETPLVSLFYSVRIDEVDDVRRRGLGWLKGAIAREAPAAEAVLDQIHDIDQLTVASYFDVVMPRWHASGLVVLGDAAHAMSPQLGQGCNLALCDAAALAEALDRDDDDLGAALARYTEARRAQLGFYQLATRWLTPFFQSDHASLAWLRDALMGPACKMSWVRLEMVRTMCGFKLGALASAPSVVVEDADGAREAAVAALDDDQARAP